MTEITDETNDKDAPDTSPEALETLADDLDNGGNCIFCGRDPYHYVDNGVGYERVAVVCCEAGIALYQHGDEQFTGLSGRVHRAAYVLRHLAVAAPLIETRARESALREAAEARADAADARSDKWLGDLQAAHLRILDLEAQLMCMQDDSFARVPDREAVARAIRQVEGCEGCADDPEIDNACHCDTLALAAIAAMQERTPHA